MIFWYMQCTILNLCMRTFTALLIFLYMQCTISCEPSLRCRFFFPLDLCMEHLMRNLRKELRLDPLIAGYSNSATSSRILSQNASQCYSYNESCYFRVILTFALPKALKYGTVSHGLSNYQLYTLIIIVIISIQVSVIVFYYC